MSGRSSRWDAGGFTLLELVVVLFIIGLLSGVAVLSASRGSGERQVEEEARRLAALCRLAADEAVIGGRPLGMWFAAGEYGFLRWHAGEWREWSEGVWQPRRLPQRVGLVLELREGSPLGGGAEWGGQRLNPREGTAGSPGDLVTEEREAVVPQVVFLPSGEQSPFRVIFSLDRLPLAEVVGLEVGTVSWERSTGGSGG